MLNLEGIRLLINEADADVRITDERHHVDYMVVMRFGAFLRLLQIVFLAQSFFCPHLSTLLLSSDTVGQLNSKLYASSSDYDSEIPKIYAK
jgi:hypothetical protein